MNREKERIIMQINSFRENLDEFKNIGLVKPASVNFPDGMKERTERGSSFGSTIRSKQSKGNVLQHIVSMDSTKNETPQIDASFLDS